MTYLEHNELISEKEDGFYCLFLNICQFQHVLILKKVKWVLLHKHFSYSMSFTASKMQLPISIWPRLKIALILVMLACRSESWQHAHLTEKKASSSVPQTLCQLFSSMETVTIQYTLFFCSLAGIWGTHLGSTCSQLSWPLQFPGIEDKMDQRR